MPQLLTWGRVSPDMMKMAALAALTAALASSATAAAAPAACDLIPGRTVALTERWRVVVPPRAASGPSSTSMRPWLACRRTGRPAPQLLEITTPGGVNASFADGLAGSRLLLRHEPNGKGAASTAVSYQLIDLAAQRRATLEAPAFDSDPSGAPGMTLLANGATFSWRISAASVAMPSDQVVLRDGRGTVVAARHPTGEALDVAQPRGREHVAYIASLTGGVRRVESTGPAPFALAEKGGLRRIANPFARSSNARVVRRLLAASGNATITSLQQLRPAPARTSRVRLGAATVAEVVADRTVRVLAASGHFVLLDATFSDKGKRSVRLIRAANGRQPEVIATVDHTLANRSGAVALTPLGGLAIADGDELRIWDGTERSIPVVGVHDLAAAERPSPAQAREVFYTDGAGLAHRLALGTQPG